MADEKKTTNEEIKNDELTDEQTNEAAGGTKSVHYFRCDGCGRSFNGSGIKYQGKSYCTKCVPKIEIL